MEALRTLRVRLLITLGILVVALVAAATARPLILGGRHDEVLISLAGRQRTLGVQLAQLALEYERSGDEALRSDLRTTADLFEGTLHAMLTGGETTDPDGERVRLRPVVASVREPLERGAATWSDLAPAIAVLTAERAPDAEAARGSIDRIIARDVELVAAMNDATVACAAQARRASGFAFWFGIAAAAVGLVASLWLERVLRVRVIRPLDGLVVHLGRLMRGNLLMANGLPEGKDEVGQLAECFTLFSDQLASMIRDITHAASTLGVSVTDLQTSSGSVLEDAAATTERATSIAAGAEELAASTGTLLEDARLASSRVREAAEASGEIGDATRQVDEASNTSVAVVGEVDRLTADADREVRALDEAAAEIRKVIETIREIAAQTNLLALNATIEAARAGDAGKGFAVVAGEVKALALKTSEATSDIGQRLGAIGEAGNRTSEAIQRIANSIGRVHQATDAMRTACEFQTKASARIRAGLGEALDGVSRMETAIDETARTARTISAEVANVRETADATRQKAEKTIGASNSVAEASIELHFLTMHFKTQPS
jgi:methyl-accepting chemotaxis protein